MKSASVAAAAAVLAGVSIAQPHGHHGHQHLHAKRDLVTEWETVWETVTVLVDEDTTQTLVPTHTTSGAPGEFFQPPSSTTPEPQPEPTVAETTTVESPPPTTTAKASSPPPPPPPPAPTTTSTTPEPEPTSTPEPEPEPTTVAPPPPPAETPSTLSTPSTPDSGSSYAGPDSFGTSSLDTAKYSGDITYYDLGLGACGYDDAGTTEHIVALSKADWYKRGSGTSLGIDMPNHAWCDQTITITAGGKSTTALVHDICPDCESGSIDVSDNVFMTLFGSLEAGRKPVSWSFN